MNKVISFISHTFPFVKNIYQSYLSLRQALTRLFHPFFWFNLRSLTPISQLYGLDRGQSVDRFYIETFLNRHRHLIKGHVLEVADNTYTNRFGGSKVSSSDILDIDKKNPYATIYDDLRHPHKLKKNYYDCLILTQVFQFIDDNPAAIKTCHHLLKKGGVLLATVPCFSRADVASGINGDFWRYTAPGVKYLFSPIFKSKNVQIFSYGNVLSGTAFWQGISLQELTHKELEFKDKNFPLVIAIKAIKA